ncbi:hypothetical protein [Sulfitobacter sp. CS16]|uniref:hypothetical protein n=1 Tax=Sulfitobacter sp. CS16 TaxID=3368573 RepID=UPI003746D321
MTDDSDTGGSSGHAILCGICRTPIAHRVEGDPNSQAGCSACDNWADLDEVNEIAREYVADSAQLFLNRGLADAARGSKFMKFSGQTSSNKTYRFVVDVDL